jgi:phosphoserine/homoserine phosphotransferase
MIACLDLEGVLLPEIWIKFAEKSGIDELKITTRDIPDYSKLMRTRLQILQTHNLKINDIQDVINTLEPLEGAKEFLSWCKDNNISMGVCTNKQEHLAIDLLKKINSTDV